MGKGIDVMNPAEQPLKEMVVILNAPASLSLAEFKGSLVEIVAYERRANKRRGGSDLEISKTQEVVVGGERKFEVTLVGERIVRSRSPRAKRKE